MTQTKPAKSMTFFSAGDAVSIDKDDLMSPPVVDSAVAAELDLSPLQGGADTTVVFKGDGPDGFSLVRARFKSGFRLPRHSHSADCLYYVVSGEAHMGTRVLKAGDGFFVSAETPYVYAAGPEGVEVLEFRTSTSFDMKVYDQTADRWRPIVEAAIANRDKWHTEGE